MSLGQRATIKLDSNSMNEKINDFRTDIGRYTSCANYIYYIHIHILVCEMFKVAGITDLTDKPTDAVSR